MQLKKTESKKPRDNLFDSSSSDEEEEESNNDGRLVQSKVSSVLPPCGKKRDGQKIAEFVKWREKQSRKKSEEADPPYVPEEEVVPRKNKRKSGSKPPYVPEEVVPQKKNRKSGSNPPYVPEEVVPQKKNRKSGSNTDVRFVCSVILFFNTDEFI
jgi:hypothetical protein